MADTRINLNISAIDDDGKDVYHVMHIGFFPNASVRGIVERLNVRGIAFHSDIQRQTGMVQIVTCHMNDNDPEITARWVKYEPKEAD